MSNITQKQQLTDALNLNHLLTTPAHCYWMTNKGKKKPTSPVLIPVTKALKYNKNVHKIIYVFDKCDDTSLGKLQESLPRTLKISKQNL